MAIGLRNPEVLPDDFILRVGTKNGGRILNRSTTLTANTALADVLLGTPVVQAMPANSVILSNVTANGDFVLAVNNGGNSLEALRVDASVYEMQFSMGVLTLPSRVAESPANYYRAYAVGKAGLAESTITTTAGKAFDAYFAEVTDEGVGEAGAFIANITMKNSTGAGTSQGFGADLIMDVQVRDAKYYGLTVQAKNTFAATTEEKGGIRVIASSGGQVTYGLQISGTQGYTDSYIRIYDTADGLVYALTPTLAVFNESQGDIDFRIESDANTDAFRVDAGLFSGVGAIGIGRAAQNFAGVLFDHPALTATAGVEYHRVFIRNNQGAITVPTGVAAYVTSLNIDEPNITVTGTVTNAASLRISGAPTEGGTINAALWVDSGASLHDDGVMIGAYSTNNLIDDASNGAGSTQLYVGNKKILVGNAVNFGPAAVASITVVDGQITAIS